MEALPAHHSSLHVTPCHQGPTKLKSLHRCNKKTENHGWQEQRRGLHFPCPQAFHLSSPSDQDSPLSITTLSEKLLHVPCCHPTALQSWHSPCEGPGAIRVSGHSQPIPRNSALLALLPYTELGESKSAISCRWKCKTSCIFLQQGKIPAFQCYLE